MSALIRGELEQKSPGFEKLVEVRSASDFAAGQVPGAMKLPPGADRVAPRRPESQHVSRADSPSRQVRPHDGGDEGMTPPQLLPASLGSCAGFYAAGYLRKYKDATEGTRLRVTAETLKDPSRVDNFRLEIETPSN